MRMASQGCVSEFEQVAHGLEFALAAGLVEERTVHVLDGGELNRAARRWPTWLRLRKQKRSRPTPRSAGRGTIFGSAEKMPASVPSLPQMMGNECAQFEQRREGEAVTGPAFQEAIRKPFGNLEELNDSKSSMRCRCWWRIPDAGRTRVISAVAQDDDPRSQ